MQYVVAVQLDNFSVVIRQSSWYSCCMDNDKIYLFNPFEGIVGIVRPSCFLRALFDLVKVICFFFTSGAEYLCAQTIMFCLSCFLPRIIFLRGCVYAVHIILAFSWSSPADSDGLACFLVLLRCSSECRLFPDFLCILYMKKMIVS